MRNFLSALGLVDKGEQFEVCEYLPGVKEAPTRRGGFHMVSYLVPGDSELPGHLRIGGNMPVGPMTAGKLRGIVAGTPYYAAKISRYLNQWGVDLVALKALPEDALDLPARNPSWWERNTKLYPWWPSES